VSDPSDPTAPALPFATRLWFAWVCFFRVLFDPAFAYRAFQARSPELPPRAEGADARDASTHEASPPAAARVVPKLPEAADTTSALQLLALLQRDGRLVDFVEQDIASFSDAEIGAAARVVHEGCRKALRTHATFAPVRSEDEGARVVLDDGGFSPNEVKLSGNVGGKAPYRGVLRHRGWRAVRLELPVAVGEFDAAVIAPAEVEL
jgi:hypothetical protein